MGARKTKNPRAKKAAFTKKRKELFSEIRKLNASTGASAAAVIITPTGECYAYGAPSVEAAFDKFPSNGGVSSDTDKDTDTDAAEVEAEAAAAAAHEKRIKDLTSYAASIDVDRCKNDLSEMLKLRQHLMQLRGELHSLICARPSS